MSIFAGPPLWGFAGDARLSSFPLQLRVGTVYLNDRPINVPMEDGVFVYPVPFSRDDELSFDILEADLGRPYFLGKPGFWRYAPPEARVALGAAQAILYLDPVANFGGAFHRRRAPTGHMVVELPVSRQVYDFSSRSTRVYLNFDRYVMRGRIALLWGVTFKPASMVVVDDSSGGDSPPDDPGLGIE